MDLLKKLIDGNNRFVSGNSNSHNSYDERFNLIEGQKPYVAIVGCSDSRVPLEIIFDENFGSIFAIRNPGNMANNYTIGSLEFAVEVLSIKLIIVLGHESCGMINAALKDQKSDSKYLNMIISNAKLFIKETNSNFKNENNDNFFIKENVKNNITRIKNKSKIISEKIEQNRLNLFGGFYNLHSGKVDFYRLKDKVLESIETL